jgi:DNA-binding transcriptional LysR family regulator
MTYARRVPVPGSDLDLRLVGYFTVVAEHLHFGRAAAALHLSQPSLSRQIQRLEEHLGGRLFHRTPQGSLLTDAGRLFLPQARALLEAAHRATASVREAEFPQEITIGYAGQLVITPAVRELRRRHPSAHVRTRHLNWYDARALADRRVDALVTRAPLPFPADRLHLTHLYAEPRVLVISTAHRLAGRPSVTLDGLTGEAFATCPASPTWTAFWLLGARVPSAPADYESFQDILELVADGRAVVVTPVGDRRAAAHPELTAVALDGVEDSEVVLATRPGDLNPLVEDFITAAKALGPMVP